jgi:hypothetical protein
MASSTSGFRSFVVGLLHLEELYALFVEAFNVDILRVNFGPTHLSLLVTFRNIVSCELKFTICMNSVRLNFFFVNFPTLKVTVYIGFFRQSDS